MLDKRLQANGRVLLCDMCLDARGYAAEDIVGGSERSTMGELAKVTAVADRTLVF
ncbi:MAG: DsrE family protein [Thioalkalivibrio sp.]